MEQNGKRSKLFGDIVRLAITLLERLSAKIMQNVTDFAEKVIGKEMVIKETPKEAESHIYAENEQVVQLERKKIPFPFNQHRKADVQNQEERPPQPQPSIMASKYLRRKEIDERLKEQSRAIFGHEKKRDKLKKELSECTGIFKGGRRKELQQEIDGLDVQILNMKKRLSSIVKEYKFDSVQAFSKELNVSQREYFAYKATRAEWEKTYGEKAADSMGIRDRLRQKEQVVKEREAGRVHQARQKDKRVR